VAVNFSTKQNLNSGQLLLGPIASFHCYFGYNQQGPVQFDSVFRASLAWCGRI
jgi:hypothetical protein